MANSPVAVRPTVRALILLAALVALLAISWFLTGALIPSDPKQALLFQSTLLLVVLGTLVLERYFTGPGDAFVNALGALLTVLPYRASASNELLWWGLVSYLSVVLLTAFVALALQRARSEPAREGWVSQLQSTCYAISSFFGRARVVFSVVFLVSVVFYVREQQALTTALLLFWAVYVAMWPMGIPQFLSRLARDAKSARVLVGSVARIDSPYLARVVLRSGAAWPGEDDLPLLVSMHDGTSRWGLPLVCESRADGVWGTLLLAPAASLDPAGTPGSATVPLVSDQPPSSKQLIRSVTRGDGSRVLGVVREGSSLGLS